VFGWFLAIVGGISVPLRLFALVAVLIEPQAVRALSSEMVHPVQVFFVDHAAFAALLYLLASVLLLVAGVGLIRRRWWALPVGGGAIVMGAARTLSSLTVVLTGPFTFPAHVDTGSIPDVTDAVIAFNVFQLAWLAFLIWFFRRPSILAEFSMDSVHAETLALPR
jgi:hypothetical protein